MIPLKYKNRGKNTGTSLVVFIYMYLSPDLLENMLNKKKEQEKNI